MPGFYKTCYDSQDLKGNLTGRPIAPAPSVAVSSTISATPALMSSLQGPAKVLSLSGPHAKYPTAQGLFDDVVFRQQQQMPFNPRLCLQC